MLNHVRSWLYVGDESRPFVVLDGLPGLCGLKYESATAPRLPLYLCSYKSDGSVTESVQKCTLTIYSYFLTMNHQLLQNKYCIKRIVYESIYVTTSQSMHIIWLITTVLIKGYGV